MTEESKKTDKKEKVSEVVETKVEDKKIEEVKTENKKPVVKERQKKTEAVVNGNSLPLSTKYSAAICKFIKGKKIDNAIIDLEAVAKLKKPVPMSGEIPHRKGKGIMSGRFPQKAAKNFIVLLKSLKANASYNGIENPVIVEAYANIGSRPFGRFGAVRKKRTHVKISAREALKSK